MTHSPEVSRAEAIAADLAAYVRQHRPTWRLPFVLCRKLKGLGGRPEDYRGVVQSFCEQTGYVFLDFLTDFLFCWEKIRHPETGEDTLAEEFAAAKAEPVPLPDGVPEPPHEAYRVVYALAHRLAVFSAPDPFFLPRARIAELLGCRQPKTTTRIVDWMLKHNLVKCVDSTCWPGRRSVKGKCKLYRLLPTKRREEPPLLP